MTSAFLAAALVLLIANGFFVAAEFALVASRATRLAAMAEDGDRRSQVALASIKDLQRQLAGAQLGITMASLGLGFVAEPAVADLLERAIESFVHLNESLLHTISFAIALSLVVVLHMVVGEMVPKNVAIAEPETTARWLSPIHRAYVTLFNPIIWFLNTISNGIVRALGFEPVDELGTTLTVQEFHTLIAGAREGGLIEEKEHELLAGALDFRARTAASIMVKRSDVVTVSRASTVAEIEALVNSAGHSRLPVWGTSPDDILGFVHAKDLLRLPTEAQTEPVPLEMIRRMLLVPPDRPVRDLMFAMRRQRRHMALVRGADGHTLGMVTLEDVLEALVGDIRDESDRHAPVE